MRAHWFQMWWQATVPTQEVYKTLTSQVPLQMGHSSENSGNAQVTKQVPENCVSVFLFIYFLPFPVSDLFFF